MYTYFQTISHDDEWYESLEFENEEELDMADAVKIRTQYLLNIERSLSYRARYKFKNALRFKRRKNCLLL